MHSDPSDALAGGIIGVVMLLYLGAILLGILSVVFWIVEIVDVARREFADPNTKLMWLLIVILLHGLGALIYYLAGKKLGWLPSERPLASRPTAVRDTSNIWPPPPGSSY